VARIPIPLADKYRGKGQVFEIGASVEWPEGFGTQFRFREGFHVPGGATFGMPFQNGLAVVGILAGQFYVPSPARVQVQLPDVAVEVLPDGLEPELELLWELGGPLIGVADNGEYDPLSSST
jgi:hypothetical protein